MSVMLKPGKTLANIARLENTGCLCRKERIKKGEFRARVEPQNGVLNAGAVGYIVDMRLTSERACTSNTGTEGTSGGLATTI